MLTTANLNNKGLTLVEVLIASVITLVLFMALMQTALLSIDMNTGNDMRNEAIRIAEQRKAVMKGELIDSDDFTALDTDPVDPDLDGADCPPEFVDAFGTNGELIERNIRNIQDVDFCTNLTCAEPTGAGGSDNDCATPDTDIKLVNFTVGWVWKGEDYMHRATTIVRRP
jgi:prepilin-type N-terminal cleavage/methylation domain-containing protein